MTAVTFALVGVGLTLLGHRAAARVSLLCAVIVTFFQGVLG